MIVGERGGADEDEGLVARADEVGIDPVDVDLVAIGVAEIMDGIVLRGRWAEEGLVEDEVSAPVPAKKVSFARPAMNRSLPLPPWIPPVTTPPPLPLQTSLPAPK